MTTHLQPFLRGRPFVPWDDTQLRPGDKWTEHIQTALSSASVAVLLVTTNYLASRFIATVELPEIFRRQVRDGLRIIWIPVSASAYMVTDLKDYQAASDPCPDREAYEMGGAPTTSVITSFPIQR